MAWKETWEAGVGGEWAQKTDLQSRIWREAELQQFTWFSGKARRASGCCIGLKEQPSLSPQGLTQSPDNAETNPEGNPTHSSSHVVCLLSDSGCLGEGNNR